jgi:chaperonin GroEL (HSP60 family)
MKLLDIVHPAAKALVDIARSQDNEVGDGTTTVVVLAGEFLKEVRAFIEEGVNPRIIVRGYREAGRLAVEHIKQIAVKVERDDEKYDSQLKSLLTIENSENYWRNVPLLQCRLNSSALTRISLSKWLSMQYSPLTKKTWTRNLSALKRSLAVQCKIRC